MLVHGGARLRKPGIVAWRDYVRKAGLVDIPLLKSEQSHIDLESIIFSEKYLIFLSCNSLSYD